MLVAGTPLEVSRRAAIPYLIYFVLGLYVLELGFVSAPLELSMHGAHACQHLHS